MAYSGITTRDSQHASRRQRRHWDGGSSVQERLRRLRELEAEAEKEALRSARTFNEIRQERRELEAVLGEGQHQEEGETKKRGGLIIGPWAAAIAAAWRWIGDRGGRTAQGLVAGGTTLAVAFVALAAVHKGMEDHHGGRHPLAGPPAHSAPAKLPPVGAVPPRVGPPKSGPPVVPEQPPASRPRPRPSGERHSVPPAPEPTRSGGRPSEPTPPTDDDPAPPPDAVSDDDCSLVDLTILQLRLHVGCLSL